MNNRSVLIITVILLAAAITVAAVWKKTGLVSSRNEMVVTDERSEMMTPSETALPTDEDVLISSKKAKTAPELADGKWINSDALTLAGLKGRVVMVDFWTFGCYNCVNTLPHMTQLYAKYRDRGLVVVGIHTPEFPFERSASNVQAALKRHGITYPVAQDNSSATWNAYSNNYWPAQYIVDQQGRIIYTHAGEGAYEEMDRTIGKLLNASS